MSAILPSVSIDRDSLLAEYFMPHQFAWILAEDPFHEQKKQVFALAEKSVRIGWTYADAFKNVRKRLRFKKRDYLFATKDYPSAIEYMRLAHDFTDLFNFTKAIVSHGEDYLKVNRLNPDGRSSAFSEEIKISYIKFDNGSRIIAFSAHPQAMAVYGGDVGLDEFARHPNAELLWQTAQGRVTWAYDLAVWSSHEGDDTLFNQFAQQARSSANLDHNPTQALTPQFDDPAHDSVRASLPISLVAAAGTAAVEPLASPARTVPPGRTIAIPALDSKSDSAAIQNQNSKFKNPSSPWNLYFKVTITDAIELGLLDVINRTRDARLTPDQFVADCRARSGLEQIFQQSYMCNPVPGGASIVEWSAIERCRSDYEIERVHLEDKEIIHQFGDFDPARQRSRQSQIESFLRDSFPSLLNLNRNPNLDRNPNPDRKRSPSPPLEERAGERRHNSPSHQSINPSTRPSRTRLGFDIAASGQGDLAAFYIDEAKSSELWLRALLTVRTEDWDFLKTVLFYFLSHLPFIQAAGDATGLGRQICWEASKQFSHSFLSVNFTSKKHDLGFALMNQLSVAEKRFPKDHHDVAADYFALRKVFSGNKWAFIEGRNASNPLSHCDIAWAGALATHAHSERKSSVGAAVLQDDGTVLTGEQLVARERARQSSPEDPNKEWPIWDVNSPLWKREQ